MSIGGNDAGFADDLKSCYENRAKLHWSQACSYEAQTINTKIAGIKPNLIADLRALHARAPHARIILMTYPSCSRSRRWATRDASRRARLPDSGGSVVLQPGGGQARRHDLRRCSGSRRRRGVHQRHERVCRLRDRPEQSVRPGTQLAHQRVDRARDQPGAYHPTDRGQQILGQLIDQEIANPPSGSSPP